MHAEIRPHNGAMTIFIDGRPYPLTTYKATESTSDEQFITTVRSTVPEMARRGVHVHFVPVFFDWSGPGAYDFSRIDLRIRTVLAADPEAWIIIRIQAWSMAPQWWLTAHPEAVCTFGFDAATLTERNPYETWATPSLGSDFWETDGVPAIEAIAHHVRRQDYAGRIVGYLPTAYNTNEWFFRSYDELRVGDLCPAMQRAFAAHLRTRYGIENAAVPGRAARGQGDWWQFIDPDPRRALHPSAAFYRFFNERCAEVIMDVTRALRRAHQGDRLIIGTFYGYSQGLAHHYWLPDSGHLALHRLLADDGPDFTCSPITYMTRNFREDLGGGFCWSQSSAPDAARLAGKGYFGEDDFRPVERGPVGWTSAGDVDEDIALLQRNFMFSLGKGQLQWWYDLGGGWYEGAERLAAVEQCCAIARAALDKDRTPCSQVAVIMDEAASWYLTLDWRLQRALFWESFYYSFDKIGAPVDLWLLSDLERVDWSQYRAVFLPSCFCLDEKQRAQIDALKRDGRWLVFYYADGLIDPARGIDPAGVAALADMAIEPLEQWLQLRVTLGTDHPLTAGCADASYGVHLEKPVNFLVADPDAEVFGWYSGRSGPALACKRHDDWVGVYTAAPGLHRRVVRNICAAAGTHIYTPEEVVMYANASYVGFFSRAAGALPVTLPRAARVRECFSGSTIAAEPVSTFAIDAQPWRSYLFELS